MKQGLIWRIPLAVIILLVSVIFVLPTFLFPPPPPGAKEKERSGLAALLPSSRVNLGLDLMGGIHLTLEVETQKALEASLSQMGQDLISEAASKGILMTRPILSPEGRLEFSLASAEKNEQFRTLLSDLFNQMETVSATPSPDGRIAYVLALTDTARDRTLALTVDQALTTIRNRIDQFGVAEPDVRKEQGGSRISIQLPGMSDPQRAVEIIGKTAHLEFRIVRDDVDPKNRNVPRGVQILPQEYKDAYGDFVQTPLAVEEAVALTGEHITNAAPAFDQSGNAIVGLTFDRRGADIFSRVTGQNVNKRMAIVLDGKVYSAPRIESKIDGGRASITGNFTPATASDLAVVLRAGALPAPVLIMEQRTVGPSLGQESINMGVTAALVGGVAIIVFMSVYYSLSGVISSFMLFLDILMILAGLSIFGATLTLPGIAGIVLTLGMAVDANVLIFERIREELRRGLTPAAAVEAGFSRAMLAITDSNLTTILAALILYQFGTGPVRGFAVTLSIGVLVSMFTAIFVSHIIFDIWIGRTGRRPSI